MEIAYETLDLREVFQFPAKAVARYGSRVAKQLAIRFADIRALTNASEFEAFSPRYRMIQGAPALEIDLAEGYSLVLVPNHPKQRNTFVTDWKTVRRIKVLEIVRAREQT